MTAWPNKNKGIYLTVKATKNDKALGPKSFTGSIGSEDQRRKDSVKKVQRNERKRKKVANLTLYASPMA